MIENLQGIHETVNYKKDTGLRLYVNDEAACYPSHWHSPVEIVCPLDGGYKAVCNNDTFLLRPGDILVICPGTIHTLSSVGNGTRIIFQADCSVLYMLKSMGTILSFLAPAVLIRPETFGSIYPSLHRLLMEIKDEYLSSSPLSEAMIYAKLIELIVLIGNNHSAESGRFDTATRKRQEYNEKLMSICNYIQEHCTEDLSLEHIAGKAGFSKYYFDRIFKQFTGAPFYRYLNQKRIALAEQLLIDPDISITEVAFRCGFTSAGTFTRMFKIIKLCTPSDFRSMYRKS